MNIGIAQINSIPGDIVGNSQKISETYQRLIEKGAELVLFPEMVLFGYWPGDLLLDQEKVQAQCQALEAFAKLTTHIPALVGCVIPNTKRPGLPLFNAAAWCEGGRVQAYAKKCLLPNYNVFDERRHFEPGDKPLIIDYKGHKIGITLCEDIWTDPALPTASRYGLDPLKYLAEAQVDLVLNLSASPWSAPHVTERLDVLRRAVKLTQAPIVYCNLVGGNEELLFDGRSLCMDKEGTVRRGLEAFQTDETVWNTKSHETQIAASFLEHSIPELKRALVFGIKEYAAKTGFKTAVLGLSGGIDSAVVAALAVEALGADNVLGVSLPSSISSEGSMTDAIALAKALGMPFIKLPISEIVDGVESTLQSRFEGTEKGLAEENIQARARGILLMALSNKEDRLLLTTGNKSEMAVGYGTLYGDMCGGLNPLGDVYKGDVYALAHEINREKGCMVIPESILTKAPSAELRPDQKDQDTLPPYPILDALLKAHLEDFEGEAALIKRGFEPETVRWVLRQVRLSEYKRKKAAPVIRCSPVAFGTGRRMPIVRQ